MVNRLNTKPKSEQAFKIDVRELYRQGSLAPGITSESRCTLGGRLLAKVDMTAAVNMLIIHTKPEQQIPLTSTDCNYGGSRYWFQCPRCRKRVAILYSVKSLFACRTCQRITYFTQCESELDRLLRKKNKLRRVIGSDGLDDFGIYIKPTGMHRITFERLIDDFASVNQQINQMMVQRFGSEWA